MDQQAYDLIFAMPPDVDYASLPRDLGIEDIPWERVPGLTALMRGNDSYVALEAAMVLCSWGNEDGFEYLYDLVCNKPPLSSNWMPHRLRGYDDTYKQVLDSFISYWAKAATNDSEKRTSGEGDKARKKIFTPVARIFYLSTQMQFGIEYFFWLITDQGFTEYIPPLKAHLLAIIKNPKFHHWKVADCAHLLMKFDPEFVTKTLAAHGYTLADFPNK